MYRWCPALDALNYACAVLVLPQITHSRQTTIHAHIEKGFVTWIWINAVGVDWDDTT
jgi:hypothetical protein